MVSNVGDTFCHIFFEPAIDEKIFQILSDYLDLSALFRLIFTCKNRWNMSESSFFYQSLALKKWGILSDKIGSCKQISNIAKIIGVIQKHHLTYCSSTTQRIKEGSYEFSLAPKLGRSTFYQLGSEKFTFDLYFSQNRLTLRVASDLPSQEDWSYYQSGNIFLGHSVETITYADIECIRDSLNSNKIQLCYPGRAGIDQDGGFVTHNGSGSTVYPLLFINEKIARAVPEPSSPQFEVLFGLTHNFFAFTDLGRIFYLDNGKNQNFELVSEPIQGKFIDGAFYWQKKEEGYKKHYLFLDDAGYVFYTSDLLDALIQTPAVNVAQIFTTYNPEELNSEITFITKKGKCFKTHNISDLIEGKKMTEVKNENETTFFFYGYTDGFYEYLVKGDIETGESNLEKTLEAQQQEINPAGEGGNL